MSPFKFISQYQLCKAQFVCLLYQLDPEYLIQIWTVELNSGGKLSDCPWNQGSSWTNEQSRTRVKLESMWTFSMGGHGEYKEDCCGCWIKLNQFSLRTLLQVILSCIQDTTTSKLHQWCPFQSSQSQEWGCSQMIAQCLFPLTIYQMMNYYAAIPRGTHLSVAQRGIHHSNSASAK